MCVCVCEWTCYWYYLLAVLHIHTEWNMVQTSINSQIACNYIQNDSCLSKRKTKWTEGRGDEVCVKLNFCGSNCIDKDAQARIMYLMWFTGRHEVCVEHWRFFLSLSLSLYLACFSVRSSQTIWAVQMWCLPCLHCRCNKRHRQTMHWSVNKRTPNEQSFAPMNFSMGIKLQVWY